MRNMSFALTTQQVRERRKTVTRRTGWHFAKPGMRVWAVEKAQGLKKGEHVVRLAPIEFVTVRYEPLRRLIDDVAYGFQELRLEGFDFRNPMPGVDAYWYYPESFVEMFLATHPVRLFPSAADIGAPTSRLLGLDDDVTRIEFAYLEPDAVR